MSLKTIFAVVCVSVVTIGLLSCADVPSTGPEFPDFRTQSRFINAVPGGSAVLLLEPTSNAGLSSFATLDYQGDTGYKDVAAGNRKLKLQADPDTTTLSFSTDAKLTLLILPRAKDTDARFQIFGERRTFDAIPDTVGQVRFISAALDTVNFDVIDTSDSSSVADNLSFAQSSGYLDLKAGNFTFGVRVHGTDAILGTAQVAVSNGQRHTAIIFGDQASLGFKAFRDD